MFPWLSITIRVNSAWLPLSSLSPAVIEYSFPTGPNPFPLWHQEGSSLLSSSLIMQVCASHGSRLRSQWQLYSPLACMFCHQRTLLSFPLLYNLYDSLLDKTNPGKKQGQGKRVSIGTTEELEELWRHAIIKSLKEGPQDL